MSSADDDGLDEMERRREARRRSRNAPRPRHPRPQPKERDSSTSDQTDVSEQPQAGEEAAEPPPITVEPSSDVKKAGPDMSTEGSTGDRTRQSAAKRGSTVNDRTARLTTPTVLSIPAAVMGRFEKARAKAPSHTAVVLNAVRAKARELPDLVAGSRPEMRADDLFPWRDQPGAGRLDRPQPLRIRPYAGELEVIDGLVDWVNQELDTRWPGTRKASRSEVVAVALDAYLPRR